LSKPTFTICVDLELLPIVKDLQSKRKFSSFIQSCLRSHKTVIEAESLEHESKEIDQELEQLKIRKQQVIEKLEIVKIQANNDKSIIDLEIELRDLNKQKNKLSIYDNYPIKQRPKIWHDWNNRRNIVFEELKKLNFDFTKLREEN